MRSASFSLLSLLGFGILCNPLTHATPYAAAAAAAAPVTYPHDIQGPGFLSPLAGQPVHNVQGVLTAKDANGGCYIQTPDSKVDRDSRTSEGLYLFRSDACAFAIGDLIKVDGKVQEYSSDRSGASLHQTELTGTANVSVVQAKSNAASPIIIGGIGKNSRVPPITGWIGNQDPFALPANTTTLESGSRAASLDIKSYGADFWESLEGMLVTLPTPTALGPVSRFNEFEVRPDKVLSLSRNDRGGLTLAARENAPSDAVRWDANPQAINVVAPLDGSSNDASIRLGDVLEDITGIVGYAFGLYTLSPLATPKVKERIQGTAIPSPFTSTGHCQALLASTYNVENLDPSASERIGTLGSQIDEYLRDPDVLVLNEIQDDDGATNDGQVDANVTLNAIVSSIKGAKYAYTDIDPVNDLDGGEPGGNIRTTFLWRPDRLQLKTGIPQGTSTEAVGVTSVNGKAQLTLNPGRINPTSDAWKSSRKPLVGQFDLLDGSGAGVFVIGVHLTSKGGGTSGYQNPQPPINGGVEQRTQQANQVRQFVEQILSVQKDAKIVILGDFNEYTGVEPLNALTSNDTLREVRVAKRTERYSYIFQQNSEELDHVFVSQSVAQRLPSIFVPHVNTWSATADQVSDHDPVVIRISVC